MLLILPTQLFSVKHLPEKDVWIWEHPQYFTKYNYNKKKLILHRASMQYYAAYLKNKGCSVKYATFKEKPTVTTYKIFDPIDKIQLPGEPIIIESPNFLLTKDDYAEYRRKTEKFFFNAFYNWGKNKNGILPGIKSQDKMNRKRMPTNIVPPQIPSFLPKDKPFIEEAIKYVEQHFSGNCGNTDDFNYPISHDSSRKWLKDFCKNRLKSFGDYQDFIHSKKTHLFHSLLSSSINIGFLNPSETISAILLQKNAQMNSVEGFVRQLYWREYQRYCYLYFNFRKNFFGNRKRLSKRWYTGEFKIPPVDDAIKTAFRTGYLHHIQRLMVIGSFMTLSGLAPRQGLQWFMEFSIDSYEWVMHQNVLEMVFFVSGGGTMRRPYICSSNYILKMSDYKKGEWCKKMDAMYKAFVKKHKIKLHKFRYYVRL